MWGQPPSAVRRAQLDNLTTQNPFLNLVILRPAPFAGRRTCVICSELTRLGAVALQLTQSSTLYQAPANGKNHGFPLYNPSGAPGNRIPTNGFSGLSPAINSAIFCP